MRPCIPGAIDTSVAEHLAHRMIVFPDARILIVGSMTFLSKVGLTLPSLTPTLPVRAGRAATISCPRPWVYHW